MKAIIREWLSATRSKKVVLMLGSAGEPEPRADDVKTHVLLKVLGDGGPVLFSAAAEPASCEQPRGQSCARGQSPMPCVNQSCQCEADAWCPIHDVESADLWHICDACCKADPVAEFSRWLAIVAYCDAIHLDRDGWANFDFHSQRETCMGEVQFCPDHTSQFIAVLRADGGGFPI